LASSPPLFDALVFPLIRRAVRRSPAAKGLEHIRIETDELNRTLTSRPSLAAFAEWTPKLACIDNWVAQRLGVAQIYRRRLGHRMASAEAPEAVIVGSCFTNFPVIVPRERCGDIARAMMLAGYDVGRSLYPNVHRHPKFTSVDGQSSNIDSMANSTIYLPTHFGVSDSYAEAISERLEAEIGE